MSILLDAAYLTGAAVASPYLLYKAITSEKYRTGLGERLGGVAPRVGNGPCVWVHAVSVGEMSLVQPLLTGMASRWPDWAVVLSTATNTGQATARRLYPGLRVIYYPLDFSVAVNRTMRAVRPALIILVELELWPNFLASAALRGVPVAIVNGRITERSFGRYRLIRPLVRAWLQRISLFCVQNAEYADRLAELGAPRDKMVVTGSIKYDCTPPAPPSQRDEALAASLSLRPGQPLIIGGCTWPGEDEALLSAYQRLKDEFPGLRLLLAPRQQDRFDPVDRLIRQAGLPCLRRTEFQAGTAPAPRQDAVVLLDTMGELARVYELATVVFVGGSLHPVGGHGMMIPCGLAKPVLFGPHTQNIQDVADEFLAHDAARRVADAADLERTLRSLLKNPAAATALGARARQVVDRHRGATSRTLAALEPLFHRPVQEGSHVS